MNKPFITLVNKHFKLRVSTQGGSIVDGHYKDFPFLRPYKEKESNYDISKAASFPLVPFGNRVENNQFKFDGKNYQLKPNTSWDKHILHGEGWISDWHILNQNQERISMEFYCQDSPYSPYHYQAQQEISLDKDKVSLYLSVKNCSSQPMPFGLGYHPFFHLTKETLLKAKAQYYYTEKHDFLADQAQDIPQELDFSMHRSLPQYWVNNGFTNWDGKAQILWKDYHLGVNISTSNNLKHYFIFVSDTHFDSEYKQDFFCFEPMSHSANAHQKNPHELYTLNEGQELKITVHLTFFDL